MVWRRRCSKRNQLWTARGKEPQWSLVRIKSFGHPEHATMSTLVEKTDSSLDSDPISPVRSEDGSLLRQMKTWHKVSFFQNRKDMSLLVPASSYSIAKHWVVATCSAMSSMALLKMKRDIRIKDRTALLERTYCKARLTDSLSFPSQSHRSCPDDSSVTQPEPIFSGVKKGLLDSARRSLWGSAASWLVIQGWRVRLNSLLWIHHRMVNTLPWLSVQRVWTWALPFLVRLFRFRPLTMCCTLPVTGWTLLNVRSAIAGRAWDFPQCLNSIFNFYWQILLAYMAPYQMRVVKRVIRSRKQGAEPSNLSKKTPPARKFTLWYLPFTLHLLDGNRLTRLIGWNLVSDLWKCHI